MTLLKQIKYYSIRINDEVKAEDTNIRNIARWNDKIYEAVNKIERIELDKIKLEKEKYV